jgi:hypothetical protein
VMSSVPPTPSATRVSQDTTSGRGTPAPASMVSNPVRPPDSLS